MSTEIQLAELDKETAENRAVNELTNLHNEVKEKDLDISKLELVLRNAFAYGALWQKAVIKKEAEGNKTYTDGLKDMFDAAEDLYDDVDNWNEFYDDLLSKQKDLESDDENDD